MSHSHRYRLGTEANFSLVLALRDVKQTRQQSAQ